jgi:type VI secretion system protein VasG
MENPAILLRRLNPYCARAMEGRLRSARPARMRNSAGALAAEAAGAGEGDLTVLARRYEWDMDALWQDLLAGWINSRARCAIVPSSLTIQTLMQEAWLIASLNGEEQIRSVHLLMALVEKPNWPCDGLWPLLTLGQSQLERLRPLLDAQSDERPEVQQEAELAQTMAGRWSLSGVLLV